MVVLRFWSAFSDGKLEQRNGFWYITGRGCGIDTPIKYLDKIPENIDGMSCVIIQPNKVQRVDISENDDLIIPSNQKIFHQFRASKLLFYFQIVKF